MIYTAEKLVSELRQSGVTLERRADQKLFIDGELTDEQFEAVKELKPQILDVLDSPIIYRFAENEYLFSDLETSLKIFSSENESANRFIRYLAGYSKQRKEKGLFGVMFNFPTLEAYKSELRLADAIPAHERGELTDDAFKVVADKYLRTHAASGQPLTDWMQEQDAPLFQIYCFVNGERVAEMVGNTIQVSICSAFWSATDSETSFKILKA